MKKVCCYCGEEHESVKPFEDSPGVYFDACDECAFSMIEEELKDREEEERKLKEDEFYNRKDEEYYNEDYFKELRWSLG